MWHVRNGLTATAAALCLLVVDTGWSQQQLRPATAGDRIGTLTDQAPAGRAEATRRPLASSWVLDPERPLAAEIERGPTAESRRYWLSVSSAELRAGVALPLTAGGALVRISPFGARPELDWRERVAIDPASLELVDPSGELFRGEGGMELLADAAELEGAPAPFSPGSSAFRLRRSLGGGAWTLRAPELVGSREYLIHVFERESRSVLRVTLDRAWYFDGEQMHVTVRLDSPDGAIALGRLRGTLVSPNGEQTEFEVPRVTRLLGEVHVPLAANRNQFTAGLWSIEIEAEGEADGRSDGGRTVRRARAQFGVHRSTAVLSGELTVGELQSTGTETGASFDLGVDVGVNGRYEVRGVLYGSRADGALLPIAIAHAAQWLEPGRGTLRLAFEELPAQFGAPFELRDLQLLDQSRLSVLEHRVRAYRTME